MPFPYSPVRDSFGAAVNDQSLTTWDSNWTRVFGYSFDFLGSTTPAGTVKGGHATSLTADYYNVAQFGPNTEVGCTINTLPSSAKSVRLFLRLQSPASAETGYRLRYQHGAPGTAFIDRITAGSVNSLVSSIALTLAAGDKLGFGAIGNILTGYKYTAGAWAAVSGLTYDITPDATKYTTAGYIGWAINDNDGRYDDFFGGNVGAYIFTGSAGLEICSQSLTLMTSSVFKSVAGIPESLVLNVAGVPAENVKKLAGVT